MNAVSTARSLCSTDAPKCAETSNRIAGQLSGTGECSRRVRRSTVSPQPEAAGPFSSPGQSHRTRSPHNVVPLECTAKVVLLCRSPLKPRRVQTATLDSSALKPMVFAFFSFIRSAVHRLSSRAGACLRIYILIESVSQAFDGRIGRHNAIAPSSSGRLPSADSRRTEREPCCGNAPA